MDVTGIGEVVDTMLNYIISSVTNSGNMPETVEVQWLPKYGNPPERGETINFSITPDDCVTRSFVASPLSRSMEGKVVFAIQVKTP